MKNLRTLSHGSLSSKQLIKRAVALSPLLLVIMQPFRLFAQVPTISYGGPQTYYSQVPASLTPTSTGVAAPAYSSNYVPIGSGLSSPTGVAIDVAGNVYVAEYYANDIKKIPAGGGGTLVIGTGLNNPLGIAVDAAGNVYIADQGSQSVKEIPAGGALLTLATGFSNPVGVAVDKLGNVYVANYQQQGSISEIHVGGNVSVVIPDISNPVDVAVDPAGNLYITNTANNTLQEFPAGGGALITLASGFSEVQSVVLDGGGDFFVADYANDEIKMVSAGGGTPTIIASGFSNRPEFAGVDGTDVVYASVFLNNAVYQIKPVGGYYITPALPAGLSLNHVSGFISGTPTAVSPSTNYTVTAYNANGSATATVNITVSNPSTEPIISYTGPQTYIADEPVTPLAPVSSEVAVFGYNSAATIATGFKIPKGVAVDAAGNIYVADYNNSEVKKIPAGGGTAVILGSGFTNPAGVAVDGAGNVYVADYGNNAVKEIPVGGGATFAIGSGFSLPAGVAVDVAGNVYVANQNTRSIEKIPAGGGPPATIISGYDVSGVAVDPAGNVYATGGSAQIILKLSPGAGVPLVIQAPNGYTPTGVAADAAGNVFLSGNTGLIYELPAGGGTPLTISPGLYVQNGVAVDGKGDIFFTDNASNAVKEIKPTGNYFISPFLPMGLSFNTSTGIISGTPITASPATNYIITAYNSFGGQPANLSIAVNLPPLPSVSYSSPQNYIEGTAIAALAPVSSVVAAPGYNNSTTTLPAGTIVPNGLAVDAAGDIYIADVYDSQIIKVPPGGTPVLIGSGFNSPNVVAADAAGNVYVGDTGNGDVKEIKAVDGSVITLATGFKLIEGLAVDAAGNVYVADIYTSLITKIPVNGGQQVTVGSGFNDPHGLAIDVFGNIYVADSSNKAVKEILAAGGSIITLGTGFENPDAVAVDASGNVFVSDDISSEVTEIPIGGGSQFTVGSGFYYPTGLAVDALNNVYVADAGNKTVKIVKPAGGYYIQTPLPAGLNFNTATGVITGTPSVASLATNYTVTAYNLAGNTSAVINLAVTLYAPTISYNSPPAYLAGTAIIPLPPTTSVVAPAGYKNTPASVGTGFSLPFGIAVDAAGNRYVGDSGSGTVLEIPAGSTTPVSIGSGFSTPTGVAVDAAGNVYVADFGHSEIKKILPGNSTPVAIGSGFSSPTGVAVDALGNVYVADKGHNAVKKIPVHGGPMVTLGSGFIGPTGVAIDVSGNVYVADYGNNAVKKIPAGSNIPIQIGPAFASPEGVAVDASGNVFVADNNNNAVKEIPFGGGSIDTLGSGFKNPAGVAVDGAGNVYVADQNNNMIKEVSPVGGYYINALPPGLNLSNSTGVISGTPTAANPATAYTVTAYNSVGSTPATVNLTVNALAISYSSPHTYTVVTAIAALTPASSFVAAPGYNNNPVTLGAGFTNPLGVAADAAGNVYVADYGNSVVEKLPAGGGAGVLIGTGFLSPAAVAVDGQGNVYVADAGANAVYEVIAGGATVTIASGFNDPSGIAVDAAGNVYVADNGAGTIMKIAKGSSTPVVFVSGFSNPNGVAVDAFGNVYIADTGNNDIKEFTAGGVGPTVLGSIGTGVYAPEGVAVDASGNIFIGEQQNSTILEIGAGASSTVAIGAGFLSPYGVAVDGAGNVYAADFGNSNVKEISPVGGYYINTALPAGLSFANATGTISGTPAKASPATNYTVTAYNNTSIGTAIVNIKVNANVALANFVISNGTLSPAFAAGTYSYKASVGSGLASLTVTPTTADPAATVTVNSQSVNSGSLSQSLPLAAGANTITTVVTAPDGVTKQTYTLVVTEAKSANANLASLKPVSGALSPTFISTVTSYTESVANAVSTFTVTPTTADPTATVTINNTAVPSGASSGPIALNVGSNTITTVVTAQNGTTKTYVLTVTRGPSSNAALAGLTLSNGTLAPAFATATISYKAGVGNGLATMTVTPTASDPNATVQVDGTTVISGSQSQGVPLVVGINIVVITITAQDGVSKQTYSVAVTEARSANANLISFKPSTGSLTPIFATDITSYTENVPNAVSYITITPATAVSTSFVTVNGKIVTSGTASGRINLDVGANTITGIVTAQIGTTKTYTLTVTRAPGGADSYHPGISVAKPTETPTLADDGIVVHQAISPNGDGINDFLQIDNISQYPNNKLSIMNRNGQLIYEASGYDNSSKVFDGHSNKNGQMQLPGTYFYQLDYTANGITKHKTGFLVLKY